MDTTPTGRVRIDPAKLRAARERRCWYRRELATAAGLSTSTIDALELGRRGGNLHTIARLAAALDTDATDITQAA